MSEARRRFDPEFRRGAVRIVAESGRPIAQVAHELGINEGTLGNWVARDRQARGGQDAPLSESERAELHQLRHSALTHAAEAGANTATLLAYSGHTSVASLARYARVSPEALARWQHDRDPATRRR